jgi:hypothetical protein
MTGDLFIAVFSHRDVIPEKYRIAALIEQREYLCDGAIKNWAGPQQDVRSPICEAIGDRRSAETHWQLSSAHRETGLGDA